MGAEQMGFSSYTQTTFLQGKDVLLRSEPAAHWELEEGSFHRNAEDTCDLGQDGGPCTVTLEGDEAFQGRLRD